MGLLEAEREKYNRRGEVIVREGREVQVTFSATPFRGAVRT
jgi:hypothetical protein